MTGPDIRRVDRIFSRALELDADNRTVFLKAECAGNPGLLNRIAALLDAAEAADDTLGERCRTVREQVLEEILGDDEHNTAEDLSGSTIGAWKLERLLARGGVGTVYLAQRADGQFEQRVALKVLRRGLDTDDLIVRFRAERQILSSLEHRSIARLIDGGALDDGRPFLVMEYVDGEPIDAHCAQRALTVDERVSLFRAVLDALDHAHKRLIIHRDIKPSNILVSRSGEVSLLDFGIAKLLDPDAIPAETPRTRHGRSLMTPAYSSPEQVAGTGVTTASDIYQAGAVLFEVLTGKRPEGGSLPDAQLSNDLRAIVAKAVHPEPSRRYASAAEMSADLGRFVDGRPVLARPDSVAYRLSRFVHRKPWAAPAAALAGLILVGYIVTLTLFNERLRVEQQRATAVQEFLVQLLSGPDPFRSADPEMGRGLTVVQALDLGLPRIDDALGSDPALGAAVLDAAARVYSSLDQHRKAIDTGERAAGLAAASKSAGSEDAIARQQLLAEQYRLLGDYEHAGELYGAQLAAAREQFGPGSEQLGVALVAAADMAAERGEIDKATSLYQTGADMLAGAGIPAVNKRIHALATIGEYARWDDPDRSLAYLQQALDLAVEHHGPDSLAVAMVEAQRASSLSASERSYPDAEAAFRRAIPILERELGRQHSQTLSVINNLGILYNRMEAFDLAQRAYAEALDRFRAKFGEQHRQVANGYQNLATVLTRLGRYEESIPMHEKAHEIYANVMPTLQPVQAYPLISKAYAEYRLGRFRMAEQTAGQALQILQATGSREYAIGVSSCLVAISRAQLGQPDDALLVEARERIGGRYFFDGYREVCEATP